MIQQMLTVVTGNKIAVAATCLTLLLPPLIYYIYQYRTAIKKHLHEIEANATFAKVVRNKNADTRKKRVICMELNPEFVRSNPGWSMMSFGEYLSQLEPADKSSPFNQLFYQKELEILLGKVLLDKLGSTYGAALLPMLGAGSVVSKLSGISGKISRFIAKSVLADDNETAVDPLQFNLSLMEMTSGINLYHKAMDHKDDVSPIEYLRRGEKGYGNIAYDSGKDGDFPRVFDLETDFRTYIGTRHVDVVLKVEIYWIQFTSLTFMYILINS